MISKFARAFAVARLSRGYQSIGIVILRPSARVTTSSVAVNSTARGHADRRRRFPRCSFHAANILETEMRAAVGVAYATFKRGLAGVAKPADMAAFIASHMHKPEYAPAG
jgi:hypothetical protein